MYYRCIRKGTVWHFRDHIYSQFCWELATDIENQVMTAVQLADYLSIDYFNTSIMMIDYMYVCMFVPKLHLDNWFNID